MLVGAGRALYTGVAAITPDWPPLVVVVELFDVEPSAPPVEFVSVVPKVPPWFANVEVPPDVLPTPVEVPDVPTAVCKGTQAGTPEVPKEGSVPAGQVRVEIELVPDPLTPSELANVLDPFVPFAIVEETVGVAKLVTCAAR